MVAVDDKTKLDHILKVLTVFKKTCNNQEDIKTVEKLTSELGLDTIELDKLTVVTEVPVFKKLSEKYINKSEELEKIYNTLMEISKNVEGQINPKEGNTDYQCIDNDNKKKDFCLEKTTLNNLRNISQKNCPTVPSPAPPTVPAPTATTDNSTVPGVAAVGGKKSKRRKHRRRNNRKTKKQRKNKRR